MVPDSDCLRGPQIWYLSKLTQNQITGLLVARGNNCIYIGYRGPILDLTDEAQSLTGNGILVARGNN